MGIIIGIISWAISALICLVPRMFLPEDFLSLFSEITFWLTSAILFVALWFTLIWKTRDIPKALVFFAAEWAILLVSALFFLIKFGDAAYMFDPYGSSALLFYLSALLTAGCSVTVLRYRHYTFAFSHVFPVHFLHYKTLQGDGRPVVRRFYGNIHLSAVLSSRNIGAYLSAYPAFASVLHCQNHSHCPVGKAH